MKVIDCNPTPVKENSLNNLVSQVQEKLNIGGQTEAKSQEVLIHGLSRVLGNRFHLLRNVKLEGQDSPIPMLLIGPSGAFVLYASPSKGVYRAKNDQLTMMDRSHQYVAVKPNLMLVVQDMVKAVSSFLSAQGMEGCEVQGILFFSSPGTHVDLVHPLVRIILVDGVDRFASSLLQTNPLLHPDMVSRLVTRITEPPPPPEQPLEDQLRSARQPSLLAQSPIARKVESTAKGIKMSRTQVIFLVMMALIVFFVLLLALFVIIFTA